MVDNIMLTFVGSSLQLNLMTKICIKQGVWKIKKLSVYNLNVDQTVVLI